MPKLVQLNLWSRNQDLILCNIPRHLLTIDDAEILKNVVLHSVATAFASIVCNVEIIISLFTNMHGLRYCKQLVTLQYKVLQKSTLGAI